MIRPNRTVLALFVALSLAAPAAAVCPGDCGGSGRVSVNNLIRGVNIALGNAPAGDCAAFDRNADQRVSVNELIAGVNAALNGCPLEPIFPADYRDTFVEVRACRFSIEHGGVMIRVLANDIAAQPYLDLENPLPVGSIVVKEEYDGLDCNNDDELVIWRAMRKEAPGFDPADGDWAWQWVDAPTRAVRFNDKDTCIACHRADECVARDFMCTVDDRAPRGTLEPVLEDLPGALLGIAGTAPNDVFAVGADPEDGRGPLVLHYDGSGWTRLDTHASGSLWWISVAPIAGDFYLAGADGLILQLDPATKAFTRHTTPGDAQLFGIWGTAANALWAVGANEAGHGVIWRFEGAEWTPVDLSGLASPDPIGPLNKVWGRAANDVYAVGEGGTVLHFDGVAWSVLDSGVSRFLFTVHGGGPVLALVGGFFLDGVLLERQQDGSFRSRRPSGAPQLNGVFVPPSGDAVAVGNGLSVAVRSSSGWALVDEGDDQALRDFHAVWIDADDGIWAVGGDLTVDLNDGVLAYGGPQSVAGGPVK